MNFVEAIKNKVFLAGLIQLVLTTVAEALLDGPINWYVIGFSLAVAVFSFLGRNLRGQVASIFTIIGSSAATFFNLHGSVEGLTRQEIVTQLLVLGSQIIGIFFTSPAKSIGYEHAPAIVKAKEIGEQEVPTVAPPPEEDPEDKIIEATEFKKPARKAATKRAPRKKKVDPDKE
jgi:hypothetical protein